MEPAAPSADDCLRLLRGERDEQKLAGLLLATKSFQAADPSSLVEVYRAVGPRFLRRLLTTGMGKGVSPAKVGNEQEAYLKLAVTVLATFARVPEIASSEGMISSVPLVVETVSKSPDQSIVEECYEFLSLVAASSKDGTSKFYEPGLMDLLAEDISSLHNNSRFLELAIRLLQSLVNELTVDMLNTENVQGISSVVVSLARLFGTMHNAIKFDALHMLTALLSLEVSDLITGKMIGAGRIYEGLYFLEDHQNPGFVKTSKAFYSAEPILLSTEDFCLWHCRLGHPSFVAM